MSARRLRLAPILLLAAAARAAAQAEDPWAGVALYRDAYGVPRIEGESPGGMAFGLGYAQAEDHLEPMLLAYRMAGGRLAEVIGEAAADSDAFALKMGHARMAAAALESADPVTIALCAGFAQGVNAYLADRAAEAPHWADGVAPADVLALWHCFATRFAPFDLEGVWRPERPFEAGNLWAAAPAKTVEGQALLAVNPRQRYSGPFRWYEAQLIAHGEPYYHVYGATLFGLPVLLVGFNGDCGWGLSPNAPDTADFFEERVVPGAEPRPWWRLRREDPAEAAIAQQQQLMIDYMASAQPYRVRTAGGFEQREAAVQHSPLGPVFDLGGSALYSWGVGGLRDFGGLAQLYSMGAAREFAAFEAALAQQQLPCFNIVYADRTGNVFYLYNAKAGTKTLHAPDEAPDPALEAAVDWRKPIGAGIAVWDWAGPVPIASLPAVFNPKAGYVQACGGPPWGATDDSGLDPAAWPYWLAHDGDGARGDRVRTLLRAGPRSFEDHQQLLFDAIVPVAQRYAPRLAALADAAPEDTAKSHPDLAAAIGLLRDWNHAASPDAAGMAFFHTWWAMMRAQAPDPDALYAALDEAAPELERRMMDAAADAARMLRNDLGGVQRPWGEVHRVRRGVRDEPIGGADAGGVVFDMGADVFSNGRWYAESGFGFGLVVQFGATAVRAAALVPFGSSERPASPHFADQLDLLRAGRMRPVYYGDPAAMAVAGAGRRLRFQPIGTPGSVQIEAPAPVRASVRDSAAAPAPLPPRLAPAGGFVEVRWEPPGAAVQIALGPQDARRTEQPDQLDVFVHEPGLGWYRARDRQYDPESGRWIVNAVSPGVYVLLEPEPETAAPPLVPGAAPEPGPRVPKPKPDSKR